MSISQAVRPITMSPDPYDDAPAPAGTYTKAEADALVADDEQYVMRPWTHPPGEPVIVARARGCVITDVHGKDYLDFTAGYFVNNAGHCHPRIVEAATAQLHQVLQVSGKHGTVPMVRLAKRLIGLLPRSIDQAFFSTGGSEANEFALKMARQATGKPDIAYLENAYHGLTIGALEVTASEKYRESAGRPLGTHTFTLPNAYCYRCPVGRVPETCKTECLDLLTRAALFRSQVSRAGHAPEFSESKVSTRASDPALSVRRPEKSP